MVEKGTSPLDRSELEKCFFCKKGMMHGGDIHFYEVTVGQCIVDLPAVQQQAGIDMLIGHPALGMALAPVTRVAHRLPTKRALVCAGCAIEPQVIPLMLEDE